MRNQNKKNRISTLYFLKLLHTGCSRKSNHNKNPSVKSNHNKNPRTLSIAKLLYIRCSGKDKITLLLSQSTWNFKKSDFYTLSLSKSFWVNSGNSKEENSNQETIHFQNAIYRVLHEMSNITASFAELVKSWRINDFYTYTSGKQGKIKIKKLESGDYTFRNCHTLSSTKEAITLVLLRGT